MRITGVNIDAKRNEMSLLAEFGWGGNYQTSRIWHCRSIDDAASADISEAHDERAKIPWESLPAYVQTGLADGMAMRTDREEYDDGAHAFLGACAAVLGIDRDDLRLHRLPKKSLSIDDAAEILAQAASRTMRKRLAAGTA